MEKCEWVRKRTYHALSKEEVLEELSRVYLKMEEDLLDSTIKRYGVPYIQWVELHVEFSDAEVAELTDEQMLEYQVIPLSPGIRLGEAFERIQYNFEEIVPDLANMLLENRTKYASMYSNEVIQIILQNEDEVFYGAETQLGTRLKEIPRTEALPLPVLRDLTVASQRV